MLIKKNNISFPKSKRTQIDPWKIKLLWALFNLKDLNVLKKKVFILPASTASISFDFTLECVTKTESLGSLGGSCFFWCCCYQPIRQAVSQAWSAGPRRWGCCSWRGTWCWRPWVGPGWVHLTWFLERVLKWRLVCFFATLPHTPWQGRVLNSRQSFINYTW